MPVVYRCSRCGVILYAIYTLPQLRICDYKRGIIVYNPSFLERLGDHEKSGGNASTGPLSPSEVSEYYGGRCPNCGKQLSLENIKIKIWVHKPLRKNLETGRLP